MKILFIGDIVGSPGRQAVKSLLPPLRKGHGIDLVIANAENAAGGSGITSKVLSELIDCGIDVFTSGDHIWKRKEIFQIIDKYPQLLRPANFPPGTPGRGSGVFQTKDGIKIGVVNILGRVFLQAIDCPFRAARDEVQRLSQETKVIVVDIHAEATSEKIALGWYLDGLASAILGTHTHVQTADERILPRGSAYITDVGMSGPLDSVIGRRTEDVLQRFLTNIPTRFEVASENCQIQGVILELEEKTGKAKSISRFQKKL